MKQTYTLVMFVLCLLGPVVMGSEQATGHVFEDSNGNGLRDQGETGLSGVVVSNGRDTVLTGEGGEYRIAVEPDSILFVTQPPGFRVPLDANNLPQFYYRHYPQGTPVDLGLRYPGVPASGPLPPAIDFPLTRAEQQGRFEVIWLSDPQPQTAAELGYFRDDVVAELIGTSAAFGVTLGDIMYDDLSLFPRYNRIIGQVGIPWYHVPGNHELNLLAPDGERSRETFKRYFGPSYYSLDYGDVHFVVLDDVSYLGRDVGRESPHPRGAGRYEGRIDERQLSWLRSDLAHVDPDTAVVLAMHIPLVSHAAESPEDTAVQVANRAEVLGLLAGRENAMAVAGHMHTTEHHYLGQEDGHTGDEPFHLHVLATASGSWWSGPMDDRGIPTTHQRDGTPNGYHVMTVEGNRFALGYKAAGMPEDFQMRVMLDTAFHQYSANGIRDYRMGELTGGRIDRDQVHATEVLVNLFDGGPSSEVIYWIGDRPPVTMQRVLRKDPWVNELYLRNQKTKKTFFEVEPSTHLWAAGLPDDLQVGVHTIRVSARDEYGRKHRGQLVFEVLGGGVDP